MPRHGSYEIDQDHMGKHPSSLQDLRECHRSCGHVSDIQGHTEETALHSLWRKDMAFIKQ